MSDQLDMNEVENAEWDDFVLWLANEQFSDIDTYWLDNQD